MKDIILKEILFKEVDKFREKYNPKNLYTNQQIEDSDEFEFFISAMREACKQTLELAAEKASESSCDLEYKSDNNKFQDEILELINQIK